MPGWFTSQVWVEVEVRQSMNHTTVGDDIAHSCAFVAVFVVDINVFGRWIPVFCGSVPVMVANNQSKIKFRVSVLINPCSSHLPTRFTVYSTNEMVGNMQETSFFLKQTWFQL